LDNVKGDVARICLYVYVRWGKEFPSCNNINTVFQSIDVLLEWCALDPVDTWEMGRNEVVAAIQAMGAKGITSFQLKLDQPTFDAVYANRFARLYALEAQSGMSDGDLRYSTVSRLLLIDNAVINANVTALNTLQEVTAYVEAAAQRGDKDINMLIDAAVYADLMEGVSSFFASDAKFFSLSSCLPSAV
jgi:hypothetical protein